MIIRKEERNSEIKSNLKGGEGNLNFTYICSKEQTFNKIKMFATATLKKNDSIGYHTHIGEKEIMLVNKGQGLYNDDGVETIVNPGDVLICEEGHYHSITNINDDELETIAMIIEKGA